MSYITFTLSRKQSLRLRDATRREEVHYLQTWMFPEGKEACSHEKHFSFLLFITSTTFINHENPNYTPIIKILGLKKKIIFKNRSANDRY